jgi:hypothetical protein
MVGVAFAPDGRTVATMKIGTVDLWDAVTGRRTTTIRHPEALRFCFSPDGKTVATGGYGHAPVRLWEAATGRERHHLSAPGAAVMVLAFTADGRQLFTGLEDSTTQAWDLAPEKTGPAEAEGLWADLASEDAARAYRAVWLLAEAGPRAVAALAPRLTPDPEARAERVRTLIARLDADDFQTRENASKELEKLGRGTEPALRRVLAGGPSAEVRRRAEALLERLESNPVPAGGEEIRQLRAVEVLGRIGTPEARRVLEALAGVAAEGRLTQEARAALDRLTRKPSGRAAGPGR